MATKLIMERFILLLGAFIVAMLMLHAAITKIAHELLHLNYTSASCMSGVTLLVLIYIIAKINKGLENQLSNFLYFKGKKHYAALLKEAITDGLTDLYDHRYLMLKLDEEVERSKRYLRPLSFLMIDIDNFKRYNDTFGHPAGDRVIRDVANILKLCARRVDVAARYGGEEYALILPETRKDGAAEVAESIRREVENFKFSGKQGITVSIGVGFFEGAARKFSKEDLIKMADDAMYRAKKSGKNRVEK